MKILISFSWIKLTFSSPSLIILRWNFFVNLPKALTVMPQVSNKYEKWGLSCAWTPIFPTLSTKTRQKMSKRLSGRLVTHCNVATRHKVFCFVTKYCQVKVMWNVYKVELIKLSHQNLFITDSLQWIPLYEGQSFHFEISTSQTMKK